MKFKLGDTVRKTKGSQWHGKIVGTYSTALTPEGYAVESSTENGSVQIYPAAALELAEPAVEPIPLAATCHCACVFKRAEQALKDAEDLK